MAAGPAKRHRRGTSNASPPRADAPWKLQDAKAQFSALVRAARAGRPQRVTVHGEAAVVVVAAEAYDRLLGQIDRPTLYGLLSKSPLGDLDLDRPGTRSPVREVEL